MKRLIVLFSALSIFVGQKSKAQVRVDNIGKVGMPTVYSGYENFRCHVDGSLLLIDYMSSMPNRLFDDSVARKI